MFITKTLSCGGGVVNIEAFNVACTPETKKYTFSYTDPKIYNNGMNGGLFDELERKDSLNQVHNIKVEVDVSGMDGKNNTAGTACGSL